MTILDHEAPNMASALEHALETDPPAAMHIAVAHATYWALRAGSPRLRQLIPRCSRRSQNRPRCELARCGVARGTCFTAQGELAVALAQEALALAEQFGDLSTAARALDVIGAMQILTDPASAVATSSAERTWPAKHVTTGRSAPICLTPRSPC